MHWCGRRCTCLPVAGLWHSCDDCKPMGTPEHPAATSPKMGQRSKTHEAIEIALLQEADAWDNAAQRTQQLRQRCFRKCRAKAFATNVWYHLSLSESDRLMLVPDVFICHSKGINTTNVKNAGRDGKHHYLRTDSTSNSCQASHKTNIKQTLQTKSDTNSHHGEIQNNLNLSYNFIELHVI